VATEGADTTPDDTPPADPPLCPRVDCVDPAAPQMYEMPLHLAAMEGQEKAAEMLLDNGAVINATDRELRTPLHHAALKGHVGVAAILLERGANQYQEDEVRL
jgi:ankyrin repeat protein